MTVPRDLSGEKVARLLARHYGYRVARTKGSHMTVTRNPSLASDYAGASAVTARITARTQRQSYRAR